MSAAVTLARVSREIVSGLALGVVANLVPEQPDDATGNHAHWCRRGDAD